MQVQERILGIWKAKLEVSEKEKGEKGLPRIIRLVRKLKLSEKESMVLIYAFISQIAQSRNNVAALRCVIARYGNDSSCNIRARAINYINIINNPISSLRAIQMVHRS